MTSTAPKKTLATALAAMAIASAAGAPAVSARPVDDVNLGTHSDPSYVPPPPSSIAASVGQAYEELRKPRGATAQPVEASPPSDGFDVPSAAIGAAAGTGLVIVLLAAGGLVRRRPSTRGHGTVGA